MQDGNWELINGDAAHEIEYINHNNTVGVIEALVILYTTQAGVGKNGCNACPTPIILNELHRTATLFLLAQPGCYRNNYNVRVADASGKVSYTAPPWEEVESHMAQFHRDLAEMWEKSDAITVAAYALWKINWVHPFRNGNGRSARTFAYACLCLKFGFWLPGSETIIDLIMKDRAPYEAALKHGDDTFATSGAADLDPMKQYLVDLLTKQLDSIA